MKATGLGYPATPPTLGRLAHYRAILAARLWLTAGPAWADGQAWWHSERRLLAKQPKRKGGHNPGRRDSLAQHRRQPLRRPDLGHRG
jgi:hypothetical protein